MKSKASELVLLAISLIGLLALCSLIFIFFGVYDLWTISYQTDDWKDIGDYMNGIGAPIISLWTLLITGWIAYEFNEYQKKKNDDKERQDLQHITIQLYKEFRSENGLKTRNLAKYIWKLWREEPEFISEFVANMIAETPYYHGTDKSHHVTADHLQAIYDLMAFYDVLSLYDDNSNNVKSLNYFNYARWRSFLYAVAIEYDKKREAILLDNPSFSDDFKNEFWGNVKMVRKLQRLDSLCGFHFLADIENKTGAIVEFYKE